MARTKMTSKKEQISWYFCEKCTVYITSKERDQHDQFCPILPPSDNLAEPLPCSYVHDSKLYSNSLSFKPQSEDLTDIPKKRLNNFVFISESVMNLCNFVLGDHVVLRSPQLTVPAVRAVWPISDAFLTSVFVTAKEFSSTWNGASGINVCVEKIAKNPMLASDISLIPTSNTTLDEQTARDIEKVLNKEFFNCVFCENSLLSFEFFNKKFEFKIININPVNFGDQFDELVEKVDELNLTANDSIKFYIVANLTKFLIEPNSIVGETARDAAKSKLNLIGGLDATIHQIKGIMNIAFGRTKPVPGIDICRSVLIYGLPGCGKSLLCNALAENEPDAVTKRINASEIFSKYFGETEANLLQHFEEAYKNYPKPTIIIIEEIVNICGKESKEDSSKRISSAFLNILDSIHGKKEGQRIFVLATTSNIENINPAVRRSGRLDIEIEIPVPNPAAREDILTKHFAVIKNNLTKEDIKYLANECHGFVGADLASLISKAAMHSITASTNLSEAPTINLLDLQHGFAFVKPSAMREVLIESPNVKWTDIGGQEELKLQLKQAIEWPLTHPETFIRLGINPPRGILMFGPPGCSKTMIAKALATESNVNFLSIKGPELFSMWVGESERAVRDLFRKARQVAPAIIFFDEIDAIGGERSSGSSVKERVLAQMLTEMDGVNSLNNVTIVAATNRPDLIDKALMRPGRIDRIVYVKLPDERTREEIFRIKLSKMAICDDVDIKLLVKLTGGYSGAEIQAVCQEAALKALEESLNATMVKWIHFEKAIAVLPPRTSADLLKLYDDYLQTF